MLLDFEDRNPSPTPWRMKLALAAYAILSIYGIGSAFASEPDPLRSPAANSDTFRVSPEDVKASPTDKDFKSVFDNFGDDEDSENRAAQDEPEPKLFWNKGWWAVESLPTRCTLSSSYKDGNVVLVSYNATADNLFLVFSNEESTSIKDGEQRSIHMYFVGPANKRGVRQIMSEWEDLTATVDVGESGTTRFFRLHLETKSFLKDFAQYGLVSFQTTNKVTIGNYRLDGSREAVNQLRKCAFEIAGLNLKDPFLK